MSIKIFISHASIDESLASALVDCIFASLILDDREVRCTSVPGHKLEVGSDFTEAIREDLDESAVVVGLITKHAISSSWVLFELGAAWGVEKTLKPLVSDEVDVTALPGPIAGRHVARLSSRADVLQFLDELASLISATPRTSSKRVKAIDALLASHAAHLKTQPGQSESIELDEQPAARATSLGIGREALRFGITLGWQLGRYEFAYDSQFPEAQAVAPSIAVEIERLLAHDGFPDSAIGLSYRDLMHAVTSYYSTTSSGKHAAIMLGVAAMRASLVGASKEAASNQEMERIGFSALADVDPSILPNKDAIYQALLTHKPRAVVEVMQLLDSLPGQ